MFAIPVLDLPALAGVQGCVRLPGSKSISNRALLLAALCDGETRLEGLLASDDTQVMIEALRALGCGVEVTGTRACVTGLGARQAKPRADLFLGNSGTSMRSLAAVLAVRAARDGGDYTLRGVARMHERPIGDLSAALGMLGCRIESQGRPGFPPLRLTGGTLDTTRPVGVRGDVSSQFLSALLMALPQAAGAGPVSIEVAGELISRPYVAITLELLARFGVTVERTGWQRFTVPAGSRYRSPGHYVIEGDASSASYFVAAGALAATAAPLRIEGMGRASIQGDVGFVDAVEAMGAQVTWGDHHVDVQRGAWPLRALDLDCNAIPDAAMTLAALALYAQGPTTLRNIGSWRVKETDRIAAMAQGLQRLGAEVATGADWLRVAPPAGPAGWRDARIATFDDHRIAMCFSLAAFHPLAGADVRVRIEDPACVAKTFPDYFEALFAVARVEARHVPMITVDGPTASGKGTLAARVAAALGWHHLDSGSLYRALGVAARRRGVALDDAAALATLGRSLALRFAGDQVLLDEGGAWVDITADLRSEAGGLDASRIAVLPAVRQALHDLQLSFRRLPGLVADGRDMGTVVFPDAPLKVFLTARVEERARRRHNQLISKGKPVILPDVLAALQARDAQDTQRSTAPLRPAEDALLLDNSTLDANASAERVLGWWEQRKGGR